MLAAKIHLFEATGDAGESGCYVSKNRVLATLRFSGIERLVLGGLNEQNVLFSLKIDEVDTEIGPCSEVSFSSSYGCAAMFSCRAFEVAAVEPSGSAG